MSYTMPAKPFFSVDPSMYTPREQRLAAATTPDEVQRAIAGWGADAHDRRCALGRCAGALDEAIVEDILAAPHAVRLLCHDNPGPLARAPHLLTRVCVALEEAIRPDASDPKDRLTLAAMWPEHASEALHALLFDGAVGREHPTVQRLLARVVDPSEDAWVLGHLIHAAAGCSTLEAPDLLLMASRIPDESDSGLAVIQHPNATLAVWHSLVEHRAAPLGIGQASVLSEIITARQDPLLRDALLAASKTITAPDAAVVLARLALDVDGPAFGDLVAQAFALSPICVAVALGQCTAAQADGVAPSLLADMLSHPDPKVRDIGFETVGRRSPSTTDQPSAPSSSPSATRETPGPDGALPSPRALTPTRRRSRA